MHSLNIACNWCMVAVHSVGDHHYRILISFFTFIESPFNSPYKKFPPFIPSPTEYQFDTNHLIYYYIANATSGTNTSGQVRLLCALLNLMPNCDAQSLRHDDGTVKQTEVHGKLLINRSPPQ